MSAFDDAFAALIGVEGGYSDNPRDPGNWTGGRIWVGELKGTKYGISAASYPHLDIKHLSLEDAKAIYHRDFWLRYGLDRLPGPIAAEIFEQIVNMPTKRAVENAQRACNYLSVDDEITVDGILGPVTRAALEKWARKNPRALLLALNGEQYVYYRSLPPSLRREFGVGWLRRLEA